jgi:hypothetical protein
LFSFTACTNPKYTISSSSEPLNSTARLKKKNKKKASSLLFLKSRTSAKDIHIHVTPEIPTNIYRRKKHLPGSTHHHFRNVAAQK